MSTDTQTLRERFEKKHPLPEPKEHADHIRYNEKSNSYEAYLWIHPVHLKIVHGYDQLWKGYQSGAEDNQCVVELPDIDKELDGCFDQGICEGYTMAYDKCKAAIEASGARIK